MTGFLSYAVALCALILQSGFVFYVSVALFLSSWLLGVRRAIQLKEDITLFFNPLGFFLAPLLTATKD